MADALDVAAVIVHDKELQRVRQTLGRAKGVAVAGKNDLAARQRTRPHVEDAVLDGVLALLRGAEVLRPLAGSCIGRELLLRQPNDLPALDVDAIDVGAAAWPAADGAAFHVVE